ncbi:outer membrane beta-barrel protein [uncultured Ramlibacter sp.]|uniref:outer membrane beta-barrel protein n=1 Tax=uncultured Ramlibacter sp. TaxID=260755 RepID=UPI0026387EB6|nr:outer membrane beta-barrel protein [uncultured Ramlibacter sp.]
MPQQRHALCCVLALLAGTPAWAQSEANTAWPALSRGYLGLSLGQSDYRVGCGNTLFPCDEKDNSVNLYAGSMLGNFWGVELGYINMGRVDRAGGSTKVQGLNLSLVGNAPLGGSAFGVFGKLGTTYGFTDSSTAAGSGAAGGSENGFGLSYGAGVSYDFTPKLSATLGWDSHDLRFAGSGRDAVRSTSLGLRYRY